MLNRSFLFDSFWIGIFLGLLYLTFKYRMINLTFKYTEQHASMNQFDSQIFESYNKPVNSHVVNCFDSTFLCHKDSSLNLKQSNRLLIKDIMHCRKSFFTKHKKAVKMALLSRWLIFLFSYYHLMCHHLTLKAINQKRVFCNSLG